MIYILVITTTLPGHNNNGKRNKNSGNKYSVPQLQLAQHQATYQD